MQVLYARREGRQKAKRGALWQLRLAVMHQRVQIAPRAELEHHAHALRVEHRGEQHDDGRVTQPRHGVELFHEIDERRRPRAATLVFEAVPSLHGNLDASPLRAVDGAKRAAAQLFPDRQLRVRDLVLAMRAGRARTRPAGVVLTPGLPFGPLLHDPVDRTPNRTDQVVRARTRRLNRIPAALDCLHERRGGGCELLRLKLGPHLVEVGSKALVDHSECELPYADVAKWWAAHETLVPAQTSTKGVGERQSR